MSQDTHVKHAEASIELHERAWKTTNDGDYDTAMCELRDHLSFVLDVAKREHWYALAAIKVDAELVRLRRGYKQLAARAGTVASDAAVLGSAGAGVVADHVRTFALEMLGEEVEPW